jgi:Ran GTPase-activating protein (RanGAP) involved in mRNA processing and transport
MSIIDDYHTKISTVDDLSSDSEDDFPSGYLTAKLDKPIEQDAYDSDDSLTRDDDNSLNDIPQVEFHPLSYKERKFAEKMRKRINNRNIRPKAASLGLSAAAFSDLSLNINAKTTEIDLSGTKLTDQSLCSLWTLISETKIIHRISLNRTGIGAHHGEAISEALLKNTGSLETLHLKRNNLDDHAISVILNLSMNDFSRSLCNGKLRRLDLRGNRLSEKSGIVLANAARMPRIEKTKASSSLSASSTTNHSLSIMSASPLPWENSAASYNTPGVDPDSKSSSNSSSNSSTASSSRVSTAPSSSNNTLNTNRNYLSRFDELNGLPTESLLNNELQYLQLGSSGLGVSEAALVGELLKHVTSVTSLDLSWNNELGADGALALAHTLSESKSPVEVLDLSGIRICDLDEKGKPIDKFNATYGGNDAKEPVSVDSSYQSSGVSALCFMLRSNLGVARTLKVLRLNDNCLCQPYLNKNEDRFAEWQYPPNAYDRAQVTENTDVLAHVRIAGVGDRLVWEWHMGIVEDCRASLKKGICDFAINFNDSRIQKMVRRAHDKIWDMERAQEKIDHKKLCDEAAAKGKPPPPHKWAKHKPSVRILDSNIKILHESGAMSAIAELLKQGIPPPAPP